MRAGPNNTTNTNKSWKCICNTRTTSGNTNKSNRTAVARRAQPARAARAGDRRGSDAQAENNN